MAELTGCSTTLAAGATAPSKRAAAKPNANDFEAMFFILCFKKGAAYGCRRGLGAGGNTRRVPSAMIITRVPSGLIMILEPSGRFLILTPVPRRRSNELSCESPSGGSGTCGEDQVGLLINGGDGFGFSLTTRSTGLALSLTTFSFFLTAAWALFATAS